jgi:hypothetical protein
VAPRIGDAPGNDQPRAQTSNVGAVTTRDVCQVQGRLSAPIDRTRERR